ncbi:ATP-binding protein [Nocardia sp. NPDC052278]|uniref:ATP-binding protein n=1 Tax=unclassified Nocardia TaxID=2637762 RepID=UPI0036B57120
MSGVSPGGVAGPLVGRVEEMRELTRVLTAARKGRTSAIAVTGEPGIGKTRLLQEIRREALAQGFQVLEGRGTELEREFPYAVVIDAFDEPLGSLSRTSLKALGEECLSELSRILPSLHRWSGSPTRSTQIDRHRCHRSVRMALQRLAAQRPLLLVLDDVHWVDHASLEVIAHLLRNPVPRCALMLAHRSRQLPTAHTAALARAVYDNTMSSLELGPLSIAEAAELLSGSVDTADLSDFYRECGGNPFYLQDVSRTRIRLGGHRTGISDSYGIPTIVHDVLEQEIRALSPRARKLLQAAAVAGEPFDLDLASDIAELVETEMFQTTDELVASGLIYETETPGRLAFRHPLIRRAVYERSGYGWRRNAHKRAAKALANRSTALSIRAHHLEHCGEVGDEEAITVLVDAGKAASQRAPVAAARWFRAALRLLPNEESVDRRLVLSMSLAEVLNACGPASGESRSAEPDSGTARARRPR